MALISRARTARLRSGLLTSFRLKDSERNLALYLGVTPPPKVCSAVSTSPATVPGGNIAAQHTLIHRWTACTRQPLHRYWLRRTRPLQLRNQLFTILPLEHASEVQMLPWSEPAENLTVPSTEILTATDRV